MSGGGDTPSPTPVKVYPLDIQDTAVLTYGEYALFDNDGKLITFTLNGSEVAPVYNGSIDGSNVIALTYDKCVDKDTLLGDGAEEPFDSSIYGIGQTHNLGTIDSAATDPADGLVSVVTSPDRVLTAGMTTFRVVSYSEAEIVGVILNNVGGEVSEPSKEDNGALYNVWAINGSGVVQSAELDYNYSAFYKWAKRIYAPADSGRAAVDESTIVGQTVTLRNLF